jgi:signal transduction histidine kinase
VDVTENGDLYTVAGASVTWLYDYKQRIEVPKPTSDDTVLIFASGKKLACFSKNRTLIIEGKKAKQLLWHGKPFVAGRYTRFYSHRNKEILYSTGGTTLLFENGAFVTTVDNNADETDGSPFGLVCADAHQQLFFSDFGKGIVLWRKPYVVKYDMPDKVGRIIITPNGMALNAANAIYSYDNSTGALKKLPYPKTYVQYITQDKEGEIVVANGNFFHKLNGELWIDHPKDFADLSDLIFQQNVHYASSYSFGIFKIKDGVFDTAWKNKLKFPTHTVERLLVYDSMLYAFSLSKGLYEIHPSQFYIRVYDQHAGLPSNSVYCMYKQADTIWVGTNKGFARIHQQQGLSWNNKKGFCGNRTVCIFKDRQQRLWVLSDQYLHLLVNNKLTAVRSCPLLADEDSYINAASYDDRTNKLWIGTSRKLLAVQMESVVPENQSYPLVISQIHVDGKQVSNPDGQLRVSNHTENITLQFANPHLSLYSLPRMYVRLKGYHDEWQPLAKNQVISFQKLPAGSYQLQTKTEGPDFGYTENDQQLFIKVLQPWYFRIWFIALVLLLAAAFAFIISRFIAKRKYSVQLKQLQAEQTLELERMRISRELHDNVGSMLTVVINKLADSPGITTNEQQNITGIARATLAQLRDAIWALDKSNLTMEEWMNRTNQYLQQLNLNGTIINSHFDFPPSHVLTPLKALHSFRIVQEASTNALKHAHAKSIEVKGSINQYNQYELIVQDNGIGFQQEHTKKGYGLKNINKRAADLGGKLSIQSNTGEGTTIIVTWPV